jgi:hypothetical protein
MKDREQESVMHKTTKKPVPEDRTVEGGIERIGARKGASIQDELGSLRAYVEANRLW